MFVAARKALSHSFTFRPIEDTGLGTRVNGFQFKPYYIVPDESVTSKVNATSKLQRASAATGYLTSLEKKRLIRLTVLIKTRATRILFKRSQNNVMQAMAVMVQQKKTKTVRYSPSMHRVR